jgi:hypothetical protein
LKSLDRAITIVGSAIRPKRVHNDSKSPATLAGESPRGGNSHLAILIKLNLKQKLLRWEI